MDESLWNAVSLRDLSNDLTVRRPSGIEDFHFRAGGRPPLDQGTPLPSDARRDRCGPSLLSRTTEADLLEEPKLLVLAADDLDQVMAGTVRERASEPERREQIDDERRRRRIGLLDCVVGQATADKPRRGHFGTREGGEEQGAHPARRLQNPLQLLAMPSLAADGRAKRRQLGMKRHGADIDRKLVSPARAPSSSMHSRAITKRPEISNDRLSILFDRRVDGDPLAILR